MALPFVDREAELRDLDALAETGGLLVVHGRRRIGKTRMLTEWLGRRQGWYSQAIEAAPGIQIAQVHEDLRARLSTAVVPRTWSELLEILRIQPDPWVLCLDEFPYLVASDPSLPSRMQRWIDHEMPEGCGLILAGSSQRMMHGLFLDRAAPLYGRARKQLAVKPLDYASFCMAAGFDPAPSDSFTRFALVGGIPKYWEFADRRLDAVALAERLYFDFAPYMEQEPHRILRDEGVAGQNALAVLEAVGRGAERPSEIAARLGTAQTNLSRLLQALLDTSILVRELPFGESLRSTRRTLYRIDDPALRFWFRVWSPHRSRWRTYDRAEKEKLLRDHAATVFEDRCRALFPGARRYWEAGVEIDLVAPDPEADGGLLVAEVKWGKLPARERARIEADLRERWSRGRIAVRHPRVRFAVFDAGLLASGRL